MNLEPSKQKKKIQLTCTAIMLDGHGRVRFDLGDQRNTSIKIGFGELGESPVFGFKASILETLI